MVRHPPLPPAANHRILVGNVQPLQPHKRPSSDPRLRPGARSDVGNMPPLPGIFPDYSAPIVCDRPEGREIAHGAVGRGRPRGWGQRRGSTASAKGKCGRVSVIWKGGFAARLPKSRPRLMTAGNKLIAARIRKSPWKLCNRYNRSSIAAGSGR